MSNFPEVPLTLEGSATLHQFFAFDWKAWRATAEKERASIAEEFMQFLSWAEGDMLAPKSGLFSQLGHKGDLMLVHFRPTFEELNQIELTLAQTRMQDYLALKHSYVSVVELGLYESTRKTYEAAASKGLEPHTPGWEADVAESLARAKAAMASRLYPTVPDAKFICFYPMDRKRGEEKNWYSVPFAERQRMMHEHGMIGRRYAEVVKQVITGSIGMDDWEWGVTLFAEDAVVFKKLIYEMRFDEVSAVYALFGQFFLGIKLPVEKLADWLGGKLT